VRAADTLKRELQQRGNMPLLTELVIFWLINYKDAAPTALKFPTRLRSKEA
jgi:hypothetical protein